MPNKTVEVAVIGAGIYGVSAAYHLGRAGVPTTIFERDTPGAGPTGSSSGMCRANYTNHFLARIAAESLAMLGDFGELTGGGDAGFHRTGLLYVYPPEHADTLPGHLAALAGLGIRLDTVGRAETARDYPHVRLAEGETVVWEEASGYADPALATSGLFADARRHGVEARLRTTVTSLEPRAGGGAVVRTSDGDAVECARVLLATGPWTRSLARGLGADLPLTVERHIVAMFNWGDAAPMAHGVSDIGGGYYLKSEPGPHFCVGSLLPDEAADPDDFRRSVHVDEAMALAEHVVRRVPALASATFTGGWASVYDVSPDWQPVIGEIADGVFVMAGTSGHGFKLAPALGQHLAALVAEGVHDDGLAQFSPWRFDGDGERLAAGFGTARILG